MNDVRQRITDSFGLQGLMTSLGATVAFVGDGEVHIEVPFSAQLTQQRGDVHAGAITSIVDTACGYSALTAMSGRSPESAYKVIALMQATIATVRDQS